MKKLLPIILSLVLILALSACGVKSAQETEDNPPAHINVAAKEQGKSALPTEELISLDEAIASALEKAGLKVEEIYDLEAELDVDYGVKHWDIEFRSGGKEYDYEIDAISGNITYEKPSREESEGSASGEISREEAIAIALADARYALADIRELSAELEAERGARLYEVEFKAGRYEFDYKIEAASGRILKSEKEVD